MNLYLSIAKYGLLLSCALCVTAGLMYCLDTFVRGRLDFKTKAMQFASMFLFAVFLVVYTLLSGLGSGVYLVGGYIETARIILFGVTLGTTLSLIGKSSETDVVMTRTVLVFLQMGFSVYLIANTFM